MSRANTQETTPTLINVNFSHRLAAMHNGSTLCLTDSVCLMTDRAKGILHLVLMQFEAGSSRASDALMCGAIDAAIQELRDIESLVIACLEAERAEAAKNPRA